VGVPEEYMTVLTHEYVLGVYGVFMLHFEKFFRFVNLAQKNHLGWKSLVKFWKFEWDDIVRSLMWLGILIAIDDEILAKYNTWAETDIELLQPWMYFAAGFGIDRIIVSIKKNTKFLDRKIDINLYK